jgi:hypothetical protein
VTVPALGKTDETHPVVFRTAEKVFMVVGKNAYTREIAAYDTVKEETGDVELQLGPIAPHMLRAITLRNAKSLALMNLDKVSVPRLALGASDTRQVRRELVTLSRENNAPGIGPKSSLALVQGTGPTSSYPRIDEVEAGEAERSEQVEAVEAVEAERSEQVEAERSEELEAERSEEVEAGEAVEGAVTRAKRKFLQDNATKAIGSNGSIGSIGSNGSNPRALERDMRYRAPRRRHSERIKMINEKKVTKR